MIRHKGRGLWNSLLRWASVLAWEHPFRTLPLATALSVVAVAVPIGQVALAGGLLLEALLIEPLNLANGLQHGGGERIGRVGHLPGQAKGEHASRGLQLARFDLSLQRLQDSHQLLTAAGIKAGHSHGPIDEAEKFSVAGIHNGSGAGEGLDGKGWAFNPNNLWIFGILNEGLLTTAGVAGRWGLRGHHSLIHGRAGGQGHHQGSCGLVSPLLVERQGMNHIGVDAEAIGGQITAVAIAVVAEVAVEGLGLGEHRFGALRFQEGDGNVVRQRAVGRGLRQGWSQHLGAKSLHRHQKGTAEGAERQRSCGPPGRPESLQGDQHRRTANNPFFCKI